MTIGLTFMAIATYTYFYGPLTHAIRIPDYLTGEMHLGAEASRPTACSSSSSARPRCRAVVRLRPHQYRRQDPRFGR